MVSSMVEQYCLVSGAQHDFVMRAPRSHGQRSCQTGAPWHGMRDEALAETKHVWRNVCNGKKQLVPEADASLPPRLGHGFTPVDDDEHPHARQRMHVQKINPSRVDQGLIENPSCNSTRLRVLGQLVCTYVNM